MAKIKFRETPFIREILGIYDRQRIENKVNMEQSVMNFERSPLQGWGAYLGLSYEEGVITGVEYPQPNGLSELSLQALSKNDSSDFKANCDYFNFVYNLCYQYIEDNQSRYFGRADLSDISHGKVVAMILLAHLARQAMLKAASPEDQAVFRERIHQFSVELLANSEIKNTRSDDSQHISCKSALEAIHAAHAKKSVQDDNKILEFYAKVRQTTVSLEQTLSRLNNYVLPILTAQSTVNATVLENPLHNDESIKGNSADKVSANPLVQEIFVKPLDVLKEKDSYLALYKGIRYNLMSDSFLLNQFNKIQQANFERLLQLRDKLNVLNQGLKELDELADKNGIAFFNDYLKLGDPYLKDIHRTKSELNTCLEQFEVDCGTIYRQRKEVGFWESLQKRKEWENVFLDKRPLEAVRQSMLALSRTISEVFVSIPFDFFNALEQFSVNAKDVIARGMVLFGDDFARGESHFQKSITEAQKTELNRQAELILAKQQGIADEYAALIEKAKSSGDENAAALVDLLIHRKAVVEKMIEAMSMSSKVEEDDGFVLLEQGSVDSQIIEIEHQTNGFFQIIRNYLASPSATEFKKLEIEVARLNEEVINVNKEKEALEKGQTSLKEENLRLQRDGGEKQEQIDALKQANQKMADAVNVMSMRVLSPVNSHLLVVAMNVSACNPDNTKKLATILTNFKAIIDQGINYEDAYRDEASKHDRSIFFSHNVNGKNHARKVRLNWQQGLQNSLNQFVDTNKPLTIDDNFINDLSKYLTVCIENSMNDVIIDEDYSSYKQHSFRNYLRHFHEQLMNGTKLKDEVDLTEENAVVSLNADGVVAKVASEKDFNAGKLQHFEGEIRRAANTLVV